MSSTDDDLQALADEELAGALALDWAQLAPLIPWGDSYEGLTPRNHTAHVARSYLWASEPDGDILCEVRVYLDEAHYDLGVRRTAVIRRRRG